MPSDRSTNAVGGVSGVSGVVAVPERIRELYEHLDDLGARAADIAEILGDPREQVEITVATMEPGHQLRK